MVAESRESKSDQNNGIRFNWHSLLDIDKKGSIVASYNLKGCLAWHGIPGEYTFVKNNFQDHDEGKKVGK